MDEEERKPGDVIHGTISGTVSGQVAIGKDITQTQVTGATRPEVTPADLDALRKMLADLRAQVEAAAPPAQKHAAQERVDELAAAITAEKPDLTTMEYVKQWFVKNLPSLAGAVTGVVINPIVGKLVQAAGDALAEEFRRRFGVPKPAGGQG